MVCLTWSALTVVLAVVLGVFVTCWAGVVAITATGASIDGLPSEEARALRDRMTELAEGKDAAL